MGKRMLSMLLCLVMVFALLPVYTVAEEKTPATVHTHEEDGFTAYSSADALPTATGKYYLTQDIALPSSFNAYGQSYSGKTVTICLNGHTISRSGQGRFFNITSTSNLTLCDCTGNGKITGGNMSGNGGVANAVSGGQLTISDIELSGNTGTAAGALSTQGKITLTNVVLTGNTNTAAGGSALYVATGGEVIMTDCTVTGNKSKPTSTSYNGAVYMTNSKAKLTLAGKTVIQDNTIANGTQPGNMLLQDAGTKLTIGALAEDSVIHLTTEAKKFGTASAASDFLLLAEGTDQAALEAAWKKISFSYTNSEENVAFTAEKNFHFAAAAAPEEGHANTVGYDKAGHGTASWKPITAMAEINSAASGHYYLKNDLDMAGVRLTVKNDVTICLNGFTMDRGATAGGYARAIHINAGAKLTICDCTAHVKDEVYTAGKITGGWAAEGSGAYVLGALELYDGIFTGNKTETYQTVTPKGVIAVLKNGSFTMHGGEISGNTSDGDCAGVYLLNQEGNSFTMTGGSIQNNTAAGKGAGVYLANSNATIGGDAVIKDNKSGEQASNLYLPTGVTFKAQELTEKAYIGFMLEQEPGTVAASGVKGNRLGCFVNDNAASTYSLLLNGSRLVLGEPRTGAEHPVPDYTKCGHGDGAVTWDAWGDDDAELVGLPTTAGHYYLISDVVLPAETAVGADVVLCLNGYSVSGTILVGNGSSMAVCDCTGLGMLTGGPAVKVDGGSFTLADGQITGCAVTGNTTNTGAVIVNSGLFTMSGGYILENPIHGVYIAGGEFRLVAGEISGNKSETNGAGVRVNGGHFAMSGGVITGNETLNTNAGGSALAIQRGSATITGGEIYGNTSGSGGTIYSAGTLKISDAIIRDNTVKTNGGALYLQSGTAELNNVKLQNNTSKESMGGGVFVSGATVTIRGGEITGNSAVFGGGIRQNGGKLTLIDVKITGNTAATRGGGIHGTKAEAQLTIGGATVITDNTASGAVSNLLLEGAYTATLDSVNAPLTQEAKIGVSADLNTVIESGKLIAKDAVQQDAATFFVSDQNQTFTMKEAELWLTLAAGATHEPHEKDECGHEEVTWKPWLGGELSSGHYYLIQNVNLAESVNVTEGEITVCLNGFDIIKTAAANPDYNRIFRVSGGKLSICDCKNSGHLTGGTACEGSAIFINGAGAEVNLHGGIISGNISKDSATTSTKSLGTVCLVQGTFNMYGGEISENTASCGSAVVVYKEGAFFNLYDGKICNNNSVGTKDTDGGAIHQLGGVTNLLGGSITGNKGNWGAGIRASRCTIVLDGTVISGNTARNDGGGMYILRTKLTMKSGQISNNTAKHAGGINIGTECDANLSGGSISGNYAIKHGGGLLTSGTKPVVKLCGTYVTGNTAGDRGGGMLADKGTITITAGSISYNTAKYGGAIRGANSTINIYGGTIAHNKAGDGGAFYNINTKMYLQNVTIKNNEATVSAGAFALGTGTKTTMVNVTIADNTAANYGGGVLLQGTEPVLSMTDCKVTGNTAGNFGGGVAAYRGTFKAENIEFTGNNGGYGGGFYTGRATEAILKNYTFENNTAINDGGAVYLLRSPVTFDTGIVKNNTAGANGGGVCCGTDTVVKIIGKTDICDNVAKTGGGLMVQGTNPHVTVGDGTNEVLFSNNQVGGSGGAIRGGANGGGVLDMFNVRITGNYSNATEPGAAGSAIYYGARIYSIYENVTITDNYGAGLGGGLHMGFASTMTMRNCTIERNATGGNGGGVYLLAQAKLTLEDSVIRNNTTIMNGGGAVVKAAAELTLNNSVIEGNTGAVGGGVHVEPAGTLNVVGSTITGNIATRQASGIYSAGYVYLTDSAITGNIDKKGGSSVYLINESGDGESYIPSINQFKGKIVISDNEGGEMVLAGNACVNIYGDGLAEGTTILVDQPDGGITKLLVGPYDYVRQGDRYTITAGSRSLQEADPITQPAEEEPTDPEVTEPAVEQQEQKPAMTVVLIAVIALAVIAGAAAAVLGIRKKSKKA